MEITTKSTDFTVHAVRWRRYCVIGSTIGVCASASVTLFFYYYLHYPQTFTQQLIFWGAVASAGSVNGILFGYFQQRILRPMLPRLSGTAWITASVAGLCIGWVIAVLPFIFLANPDPNIVNPSTVSKIPLEKFALTAMLTGSLAGGVLGLCQWSVLRRHLADSMIWIPANAVGWAIGMIAIYLAATMVDIFTPAPVTVIACSLGGELSGTVVAFSTSFALSRMKS